MPYFIQTFDKEDVSALRAEHREQHLIYLDETKDVLLACGAKISEETGQPVGGVYLVDVEDRSEAEAYIASDPFAKVGLFREIQIEKWRKAFLNRERFVDLSL